MSKDITTSRNPWCQVFQVLRVYWALLLGNVLEWYEYAVFSFLEPYFQKHFFHGSALSAWLGFAVTFVARPFGGLVLGVVGDIFGRKVSTFLSIFGMMVGTVGQGLLPTYQHGEVAGSIGLVLLIILRLLQGICTGGEIASVTTYITEVGPKESLCRSMMLVGVTCNIGFLLAQCASYGMELFGEENMNTWGWRVPFVVAIIPGSIATVGRRCMPESSDFLEGRAREQDNTQEESEASQASESQVSNTPGCEACSKMKHLIAQHWRNVVVGIGSVVAVSVLQYGGLIWCSVFLQKEGTDPGIMMSAGITARIFSIVLCPGVAWLGDKQGIAWILFMGGSMMTLLGMPLFAAMATNSNSFEAVVGSYGLGYGFVFAFVGMVFFVFVCELFPVEIRNAGVGLSYNIGFCCFGGFAPMIFEAAFAQHFWAPGWLLSLAGLITTMIVLLGLFWQRRGKLQLTHIRSEPYFSPCGVQKAQKGADRGAI